MHVGVAGRAQRKEGGGKRSRMSSCKTCIEKARPIEDRIMGQSSKTVARPGGAIMREGHGSS